MIGVGALVVLASFLAAFLGIFAVNLVLVDVFQRDREETLQRLNEELMQQQRQRAREQSRAGGKDPMSEILEEANREAQKPKGLLQRLEEMTLQSGLRITRTKLLVNCGLAGAAAALITFAISRSFLVTGLVGGVTAALPLVYVSIARRRRLDALRAQLPDAFELMSRILRAGQSVTQAIHAVSEEFRPPVNIEFGYCYEQQNLGLAPEVALHDLAQRTGLMEMKIFVLAVLVHRQAGGNLTELLDNIAHVVRQRFKMRREIKSLTGEGRMQAVVLLALPIVVWFGLLFVTRDYALKLLEHTTLLVAMLTSMLFGAVWIRRIVNFDF
jgi:tight adherence protein B